MANADGSLHPQNRLSPRLPRHVQHFGHGRGWARHRLRRRPDHPFTQGFLCHKVHRYPERIYSPDRILHPLRRVGKKGEGRFVRITWDKALDEVAGRLTTIAAPGVRSHPPYSYGGNMGLVARKAGHAFFHRLGATRLLRTICDTAAEEAWLATYGAGVGSDFEGAIRSDLGSCGGSTPSTPTSTGCVSSPRPAGRALVWL